MGLTVLVVELSQVALEFVLRENGFQLVHKMYQAFEKKFWESAIYGLLVYWYGKSQVKKNQSNE